MIKRVSLLLLPVLLVFMSSSVSYRNSTDQAMRGWISTGPLAAEPSDVIFMNSFEDLAITLDSPSDGELICAEDIVLTGHVDKTVVSLLIDGIDTPLNELVFTSAAIKLLDGPNKLVLEAVLTNGASEFLTVTINRVPFTRAINIDLLDVTVPDGGSSTLSGFSMAANAGAMVTITNQRTDVSVQASADDNGAFTANIPADPDDELTLVAEEANICPPAAQVSVIVPDANLAPTLNLIGDRIVDLGQLLNFTISGEDANGDPLSFIAYPLPANSSLGSASGEFQFQPKQGQDGAFDIKFSVTDGLESDSETISIVVNGAPAEGITMMSGRVIDTTDYVNDGIQTPVVGAKVSILNSGISAETGADGSFVLSSIPAGEQIFDIDPSGVMAPDNSDYAGFREAINIIDKVDNHHNRAFFLPRIAMDSITNVNPSSTTIVENLELGVRIEIPPHTAKWINGLDYAGPVSISAVPDALAPAALPPELGFGLLVTIQPVGLYFTSPVPIFFPNDDGLPEGSKVDIWSLDGGTGAFTVVGTGEVIGNEIKTVSGGVVSADWHGPLIRGVITQKGDPETCEPCQHTKAKTDSETSLDQGSLIVRHSLAPYWSVGQWWAPTIVFNSFTADPRPIVKTKANMLNPIPQKLVTSVSFQGVIGGSEVVYDTSGTQPLDQVQLAGQIDASGFPSGSYDYSLEINNIFASSSILTRQSGTTLVNNQANSPVGSGWGFAGLDRLIEQPDQSVLMVGGDGSASIYSPLFKGSGKFSGPLVKTIGVWTKGRPVIGDLNNDGWLDFIIPVSGSPSVRLDIFLNDGAGDFTFSPFTPRQNPTVVALGDFNEDNILDVIVMGHGRADIHLGNGMGGFGSPTEITANANNEKAVVVADFDGDTHLDIAYGNDRESSKTISIQLGDGAGGFSGQTHIAIDQGAVRDLLINDFNNDSIPDIAAVADQNQFGWIAVFLGDGAGGFAAPLAVPVDGRLSKLSSDDFDGDNNADLVMTAGSNVAVIFGNGDGSFNAAEYTPVQGTSHWVTAGNFDGNGNPDFAVSATDLDSITLFDGNGLGGFPVRRRIDAGFDPFGLEAADFNKNGFDDLLVLNGTSSVRTASVYFSNGPNNLPEVLTVQELIQDSSLFQGIQIADFNEDGKPDAVVAKRFYLEIYSSDGESFSLPTVIPVAQDSNEIQQGDFNQDGHIDLAFFTNSSSDIQGVAIRLGDGQGGFGFSMVTPFPENWIIQDKSDLTVGDYNNDGLSDIAFRSSAGSQQQIITMQGKGNGLFIPGELKDINNKPVELKSADITGDGRDEIISYDFTNGVVVYAYTNGGVINEHATSSIGSFASSFDIGDVDGDGIVDVVTGSNRGAEGGWLYTGIGESTGSFVHLSRTDVCITNSGSRSTVESLTLVDLDNDNDLDAAFRCSTNQTLNTALNDGTGIFTPQPHLITNRHHNLAVGDFNGDGAVDLVSVSDSGLDVYHNIPTDIRIGLRSPGSDFSELTENVNGGFTRRLKDGRLIMFDDFGRQSFVTDRNGNTTSYAYDLLQRLIESIDPGGQVTTFSYTGDYLSHIEDPAGRITIFTHDAFGNLTGITDPDLSTRIFDYDVRHLMTSQTTKQGFEIRYDYDAYGANWRTVRPDGSAVLLAASDTAALPEPGTNTGTASNPLPATLEDVINAALTDGRGGFTFWETNRFGTWLEMTDQLGRTVSAVRDGNNQIVRKTSFNGTYDVFNYDLSGNLISRVFAQGTPEEQRTSIVYESEFNQPIEFTDAAGNSVVLEYDASGNAKRIVDQLLGEWQFTHNSRGQRLTVTDPNANVTKITYNADGNLESAENALGEMVNYQRDEVGRVTLVREGVGTPEERSIEVGWDEMNRVVSFADGAGAVSLLRYHPNGLLSESETPTGEITRYTYDARDRLININDPIQGLITFIYDNNNNLISTVDELGQTNIFQYDLANQMVAHLDAVNGRESWEYDLQGNIVAFTDVLENKTTFDFDLLDRLTRENRPKRTISYGYDSRDLVISRTDGRGNITNYAHDNLSRLIQESGPDNKTDITYDPAGNILTIDDDDSSLGFTYDFLHRVLTTTTQAPGVQPVTTLTNSYDAVGNRIQLEDSEGGVTQFEYDDAGQITQVTTAALDAISLNYDLAGRFNNITNPNGIVSDYSYDNLGHLLNISHTDDLGLGTVLESLNYSFDVIGNISSIDNFAGSNDIVYDPLERVISAGTPSLPEEYLYDLLGNRSSSHISTIHVTNEANHLLEDSHFFYTYDADGNLASKTDLDSGDVTTYSFNSNDQLVQITFPDETTASYAYDGLGRRIAKDVNGVITRYVYDGLDLLLEFDETDTLQARYTHGQQIDQPLNMFRDGQSYYYHADHLGSILMLTDSNGIEVNSYTYDAYGRPEITNESFANPFMYTGREYDAESGLYYYRARYYDPSTGRFISEDPLGLVGGSSNLYEYVGNNPVNHTDPSGLYVWGYGFEIGLSWAFGTEISIDVVFDDAGNVGIARSTSAKGGITAGASAQLGGLLSDVATIDDLETNVFGTDKSSNKSHNDGLFFEGGIGGLGASVDLEETTEFDDCGGKRVSARTIDVRGGVALGPLPGGGGLKTLGATKVYKLEGHAKAVATAIDQSFPNPLSLIGRGIKAYKDIRKLIND